MRVKLNAMPSAPKEYVVDFPRLDGGLNNRERDYRLRTDESPDMKNLWWQDGARCCRDGQVRIGQVQGMGYSAVGSPFSSRVIRENAWLFSFRQAAIHSW